MFKVYIENIEEIKDFIENKNFTSFFFLTIFHLVFRQIFPRIGRQHCVISVIFQVASLLAALAHPGHIVCYAPGDSLPCRRDPS
ncbi:hypothetical protein CKY12_14855 [Photorhabdus sp. S12-55]|nr:hypothetical protein PluDJC_20665 [Photorhabdus laumondii subsp. laumondii]RAW69258.1 hypothetical protein CKY15_14575 [Photorhabdus sp. S7-51]RAW70416.1 hypothetical protein CKY14_14750 [Photorhabdus sp. S14-60]RAW76900.1 hypothetical protein CKY06_15040 [Photorhabdus sp. S15-56]RAW83432.1 hypothetical protein CKY12_14855 [Photorhabdus sp. S12-55]RAW83485.1 hypothetical protein CKY09_14585 [Photorhabdus sp. S5P8-50]